MHIRNISLLELICLPRIINHFSLGLIYKACRFLDIISDLYWWLHLIVPIFVFIFIIVDVSIMAFLFVLWLLTFDLLKFNVFMGAFTTRPIKLIAFNVIWLPWIWVTFGEATLAVVRGRALFGNTLLKQPFLVQTLINILFILFLKLEVWLTHHTKFCLAELSKCKDARRIS